MRMALKEMFRKELLQRYPWGYVFAFAVERQVRENYPRWAAVEDRRDVFDRARFSHPSLEFKRKKKILLGEMKLSETRSLMGRWGD